MGEDYKSRNEELFAELHRRFIELIGGKYIEQIVEKNKVVLFMKGEPNAPQCGFSAQAVQVLRAAGAQVLLIAVPRPTLSAAFTGSLTDHKLYGELAEDLRRDPARSDRCGSTCRPGWSSGC